MEYAYQNVYLRAGLLGKFPETDFATPAEAFADVVSPRDIGGISGTYAYTVVEARPETLPATVFLVRLADNSVIATLTVPEGATVLGSRSVVLIEGQV